MKVEVKEAEGLMRKLFVEVPADQVKTEEEKQYEDFRKKVTLKGFRKGKVPLNMIKSLYGNEVKAIVADEVVKATYPLAVREATLHVASYPNVTELKYTDDGGLAYTAEVEVFPEVGTIAFDGLKLKSEKIEIADKDVDEIVEFYRVRFSDTRKVEREAKADDVVMVDLEKLDDPKGIMQESGFADVEIDLAKELTVKEFKEQIPGMKAGDEKEIKVSYSEDYPDARFAGASITYKVKINEVKERIMPEFDDALAKRSGQAETALELRMKIRDELLHEKEDIARNAQKREVIKQVCDKNNIPIPEALVDEYLEAVVKDVHKNYPTAKEEDIKRDYREPGISSIRWNILFHRLAEQEKVAVETADTDKWIEVFAKNNNITVDQAREALTRSGRADSVKDSILEEKVLDFLIEKADKTSET